MYKLIKITNTGTNVPEPMRLPLSEAASCERAVPFYTENGILTPVNASATRLPTHMTICEVNGKDVLCYEITPQMVFGVKTASSPDAMTVGTEYVLSADGSAVSASKVTGSLRGAVLLSKDGAKNAGDEVFVAFR